MINFFSNWFNQSKNDNSLQTNKTMNSSLLNNILLKSQENRELISIWQYNSDRSSFVGYVTEINEEYIGFRHYTRFGKPDGIVFIKVANIKTIDFNDDYTKVMECLIEYSSIIDQPSDFEITLNHSGYWQFEAVKQLCNVKNQISSFEVNGSEYFTGFVIDFSEEDFILHCVGKNGEDLGNAIFKVEDVSEVRVNDIDDRRRLLLFNWRKASL